MIHSLLFILLTSLFTPLIGQDQKLTDCQAGTYFLSDSKTCEICYLHDDYKYWSQDAWAECKPCPTDDTTVSQHYCMCDTRPPRAYGDTSLKADKKCNINGVLTCSRECYQQAAHALTAQSGKLTELLNIMPCDCTNPTTMENCTQTKHFTNYCFINECDGKRFYLPEAESRTLDSCYEEYKSNETCDNFCGVTLSPYLRNLTTCNCYHIDDDTSAECFGLKSFYAKFDALCNHPDDTPPEVVIAVPIACAIIVICLAVGLRCYAVEYLRKLKNSGRIENIMPWIDWTNVEALGLASYVVKAPQKIPARNLSDKEIIVKIRFALFGGWFGAKIVRPQHVVLKIFSQSRSEAQATELKIINSFHDRSKAKANNIISVYGPPERSSNERLAEFLKILVVKSKSIEALKETINQCYLDRCHYIMMNHCNELSLSEFMSSGNLNPSKVRQLCKDLAKALNFLHEGNIDGEEKRTIIVHCDIKPDNIFVKERHKKTAFILGDFGFAGVFHEGLGPFKPKGHTWHFTPPEWILYSSSDESETSRSMTASRFPCKLDIYQYGLIVWLALHNKTKPWDEEWRGENARRQGNDEQPVKLEVFLKNMFTAQPDRRPPFNLHPNYTHPHLRGLQSLAELCWKEDIETRPSAADILVKLDEPTDGTVVSHMNYLVAEIEPPAQV